MKRDPAALTAGGLILVGVAVGLPTLSGFGGRWLWLLDLTSHFRLHYLLALSGVTLGLAALRRWRPAGIFLLLAAVNLAALGPLVAGAGPEPAPTDGATVRALLSNVHQENRDHDALLEVIDGSDPDLLVLLEIDDAWAEALAVLEARYPYHLVLPRRDHFGIALYSRLPLDSAEPVRLDGDSVPAIQAAVRVGDRRFDLIGLHPRPPISSRYSRLRDAYLDGLADRVRTLPGPVLVLGDFNATPFSATFRRLIARSGLRDTCSGYQPTWPAQGLLPGIPIDHALVGPGIEVVQKRVLSPIGSDHLPLLLEFVPGGRAG